jgi:hypothetical protein
MAKKTKQRKTTKKRKPRKPPWRVVFLKSLATTGIVSRACKVSSIGRNAAYDARNSDPEFAAAWDEAIDEAADLLEEECRRRAYEGITRKKFNGRGEPIIDPETQTQYYEREYSDTLLIFTLKAARPEKFRERVSNEHSGPGGKPIEVTDTGRTARIVELLERARARRVVETAGSGGGDVPALGSAAGAADNRGEQPG